MKYKFAQVWYTNDQPGYFLHVKPDPVPEPEPLVDAQAVNDAREAAEQEAVRNEEKRSTIEKQRAKIIGRLDSAEKLLRSPEGQQFAGDELEQLMEAIYTLKKKVQLVNKLSVSTRLYEDMIVREGNVLKRGGFDKAAAMLYSLAQTPGQSAEGAKGTDKPGAVPLVAPPPDPSGAGNPGAPGGLPMPPPPGSPNIQTPVGGDQNDPPQPKGIKEFTENMNDGNKTDPAQEADDNLEVSDREEELMVTEAQMAPPVPAGVPPAALEDVPTTDAPPPERNPPAFVPDAAEKPEAPAGAAGAGGDEEPLEVTEDDIKPQDATPTTGFSNKIDEVMSSVTVADIVAELEDISKDYKTRSQPRRLSKVDMMLDSIGLASMFPSLSEAQNKALEANNYISSRVDDILAKLRGAMASAEKAPAGPAPDRPEVAGIKGKLQTDQDKEQKRKQMRKEQEAAELEGGAGKETPAVEMGELAPPAAPPPPAPPARGPAPRPLG